MRNIIAISLIILSFILLIPGITFPLLSLHAKMSFLGIEHTIYEQTRSIWESVISLYESGNWLVAMLIFVFSIAVPIIKGCLLLIAYQTRHMPASRTIQKIIAVIGKWSMADVFAIGVFVAFLAGKATDLIDAKILEGFYFFTAYCVTSLLASQLLVLSPEINHAPNNLNLKKPSTV